MVKPSLTQSTVYVEEQPEIATVNVTESLLQTVVEGDTVIVAVACANAIAEFRTISNKKIIFFFMENLFGVRTKIIFSADKLILFILLSSTGQVFFLRCV